MSVKILKTIDKLMEISSAQFFITCEICFVEDLDEITEWSVFHNDRRSFDRSPILSEEHLILSQKCFDQVFMAKLGDILFINVKSFGHAVPVWEVFDTSDLLLLEAEGFVHYVS